MKHINRYNQLIDTDYKQLSPIRIYPNTNKENNNSMITFIIHWCFGIKEKQIVIIYYNNYNYLIDLNSYNYYN